MCSFFFILLIFILLFLFFFLSLPFLIHSAHIEYLPPGREQVRKLCVLPLEIYFITIHIFYYCKASFGLVFKGSLWALQGNDTDNLSLIKILSSNMILCVFWIFQKLRCIIKDQAFSNLENMKGNVQQILNTVLCEWFMKTEV